jgi:hypothetical protein
MEPIKYLEFSIENGDSLAQKSLHFFKNTLWGTQYINNTRSFDKELNTRSFDNALNCISLDVAKGNYFPAVSMSQARLFIRRLSVANKK